jgi:uncharacterized protein YcfJ
MTLKTSLKMALLVVSLLSVTSYADQLLGTVLDSRANVYTESVPQQNCQQVVTQVQSTQQVGGSYVGGTTYNDNGMGRIVGSVAGGLIGSRFGGGNGQLASVMAGTVLGGAVGASVGGGGRYGVYTPPHTVVTTQPQYQTVCQTTYTTRSVTRDYNVTIDFNGTVFSQVMSYNPQKGSKVVVNLNAE